jgi:hypothetical protein
MQTLPPHHTTSQLADLIPLTPAQLDLIHSPLEARIFLSGPWGCGKTTVGVERLLHLMAQGVPASSILLLAPQRTLTWPYLKAMETPGVVTGGQVTVLTLGGLARRMIDLFWPVIAGIAGFAQPTQPPIFLTLETAQYYMAYCVRPLLEQGAFSSITIERSRIYSQIIDNLNKAALAGIDHTEIGGRLSLIHSDDPAQKHVFEDAQRCASIFRTYCLQNNLLDFSLQVEVFWRHLWTLPLCRDFLLRTYRHLIVDNLEEDTPITHALLREWLPECESALLIYDQGGGFRTFLGADPESALALQDLCQTRAVLDENFVLSPQIHDLRNRLSELLSDHAAESRAPARIYAPGIPALNFRFHRYYPEMLDWVTGEIKRLIYTEGVPAAEIAVLAPYLPDASLYALLDRFQNAGIPVRSHRPSRALRDEPVAQCLLTFALLAHPEWGQSPAPFDIAYLLVQSIAGMDWVRAKLLARSVYPAPRDGSPPHLLPFPARNVDEAARITDRYLLRYEGLRQWLEAYSPGPGEGLDHFWQRLFGELLSQKGYGFHENLQAGEITANLIESARKFRQVAGPVEAGGGCVGLEYVNMVREGVIAAQYLRSWEPPDEDAVLLAPAHTFLMSARSVRVQFWLNLNSPAWYERLYQPLTNPYIFNRRWPPDRLWTDRDEEYVRETTLRTLTLGLLARCREQLYLGWSELNEQGREEHGRLLHTFQRLVKRYA